MPEIPFGKISPERIREKEESLFTQSVLDEGLLGSLISGRYAWQAFHSRLDVLMVRARRLGISEVMEEVEKEESRAWGNTEESA